MRIDCHTHTARYSGCSVLDPGQLCQLALERGLQGLVLTEHNRQWHPRELAALRQRFPDLALFSGVEVSTREGYDVILLAGEIMLDIPSLPDADLLQRTLAPHKDDIFSFVAHPFRYRNETTSGLKRLLRVVEGVEMNSINILKGAAARNNGRFLPQNSALYEKALREYGLVPVFNSDTHAPDSVATIANEIGGDKLPATAAELSRLLRQGSAREWQNNKQIHAFLEERLLI